MIDLGSATVTITYAKLRELIDDRAVAVKDADSLRNQLVEANQKIVKLEAQLDNAAKVPPAV